MDKLNHMYSVVASLTHYRVIQWQTFAANELKAKTAVIYLDSSTDYSKSLAEVFKNKFEALGGKVVMEEAFVAKDQDFKSNSYKYQNSKR